MGKRELVALLNLSSWCLVMVKRLFLAVPWDCRWFVIVVFADHTHILFLMYDHSKAVLLLWIILFFFCLVFVMHLCASVYLCLVVTCWERADFLVLVCGV